MIMIIIITSLLYVAFSSFLWIFMRFYAWKWLGGFPDNRGEIPRDEITTQQDTPPRKGHWPKISDITGAIHKGQILTNVHPCERSNVSCIMRE
jgi:hypothetical protein